MCQGNTTAFGRLCPGLPPLRLCGSLTAVCGSLAPASSSSVAPVSCLDEVDPKIIYIQLNTFYHFTCITSVLLHLCHFHLICLFLTHIFTIFNVYNAYPVLVVHCRSLTHGERIPGLLQFLTHQKNITYPLLPAPLLCLVLSVEADAFLW